MNNVEASHESPYGTVSSSWEISDDKMVLKVEIPVNSRAEIYVPSTSGTLTLNDEEVPGTRKVEMEGIGYHFLRVTKGSGEYIFSTDFEPEKDKR